MKHLMPMALLLTAILTRPLAAQQGLPPALQNVRIEQKLNAQVPADLRFRDETGRPVRLGDYFGSKPTILVLAYLRCPKLCTLVLNGLQEGLRGIPSMNIGREFNVLTVSFDPRETPELAARKKQSYVESYGRPGAAEGWHFLTGQQDAIDRLTDAVGFRYTFDPESGLFNHASGIMILTPEGKVSRYFYGIKYTPGDLRLGLVEASANKIGSPVDEVLLYCFHYDPKVGKYTVSILNLIRASGVLTLLILGALFWRLRRHGPTAASPPPLGEGQGMRGAGEGQSIGNSPHPGPLQAPTEGWSGEGNHVDASPNDTTTTG